ncbi:hypothetical protein EAS68_13005 [Legionella jordanis]|uniref:hypothetical protein n=1 Tax=Legionella jordanis TaxID=456 RepID=UPI000F00AF2F|nr:hypothetical protein [Legionella jordanis]RMX15101.1 hypothetical protein EAS68_13005 [Legionella jordanis]
MGGLPTSSFTQELYDLPGKHHQYELNLLLNTKTFAKSLKKSREDIQAIQNRGYNFLFALEDLFNIMQGVEPEFFKPILRKAVLVMQAPTKINRDELGLEFNRFKTQVNEYKNSHPFSTGLGYILINSLALILGIALVLAAGVLAAAPLALPTMALALGLSLMSLTGLVIALTSFNQLSDNTSEQFGFFKNKYVASSELFFNDIASDDYETYLEDAKQINPVPI